MGTLKYALFMYVRQFLGVWQDFEIWDSLSMLLKHKNKASLELETFHYVTIEDGREFIFISKKSVLCKLLE